MIPVYFTDFVQTTSNQFRYGVRYIPIADIVEFVDWLLPRLEFYTTNDHINNSNWNNLNERVYVLYNSNKTDFTSIDYRWFTHNSGGHELYSIELFQHIFQSCDEFGIDFDCLFNHLPILSNQTTGHKEDLIKYLDWWYHIITHTNAPRLTERFQKIYPYVYMSDFSTLGLTLFQWFYDCAQRNNLPFVYPNYIFQGICTNNLTTHLSWLVDKHRELGIPIVITSNIIERCCKAGAFDVLKLLCSLKDEYQFDYDMEAFNNSCRYTIRSVDIVTWWLHDSQLPIKYSEQAIINAIGTGNISVLKILLESDDIVFDEVCIDIVPAFSNHDPHCNRRIGALNWLCEHRDTIRIVYTEEFFECCFMAYEILKWYLEKVVAGEFELKYNNLYVIGIINSYHYYYDGENDGGVDYLKEYSHLFSESIQNMLVTIKN
jgi:hypothetical protein